MRFINLFSKHMNSIYRCVSGAALLLVLIFSFYKYFCGQSDFLSLSFYADVLAFILIILTTVIPQKIELLALVNFIYSAEILLKSPELNSLGLLLYVAACAILFSRGYFYKQRWLKVGIAIAVYFCFFAFQLRNGFNDFIKNIFILALHAFVLFTIIFFYYLYLRNQGKSPIEKFLDLSQYTELTERDKEWLKLILQETKYSTIASQYGVTLGTVKNRLHYIFGIIDVSDRIGFMATYGGYELKF